MSPFKNLSGTKNFKNGRTGFLHKMTSQNDKNRKNKLSIVHLVYKMGLGGIEISVSKLVLDQKARGCEVTVVCLFDNGVIGEELKSKGIEVIALNLRQGRGMLNLITPLNRICRERKADVIQVHAKGVEIPVAVVLLMRREIRKSIFTIRGIAHYKGWHKWRARFCAKLSSLCFDNVVAISRVLKEHEIHNLGRKPDTIIVIWNGVDTKAFCPRAIAPAKRAEALGLDYLELDTFVVGMGVQLRKFKDIPTLMRAAVRVKEQKEGKILFVVAGIGPLEAALKSLAGQLEIEDCFKFVGRIEDMPSFLNAIDVLALTSPFEGLGVIALEAMATGKPVVTTDSGGIRDCVIDGETGIIVPVGDDKSLAESIVKLSNDRQLCYKMGQVGLRRARRYFTLEQYNQAYWDLIADECLSSDEESTTVAAGK